MSVYIHESAAHGDMLLHKMLQMYTRFLYSATFLSKKTLFVHNFPHYYKKR